MTKLNTGTANMLKNEIRIDFSLLSLEDKQEIVQELAAHVEEKKAAIIEEGLETAKKKVRDIQRSIQALSCPVEPRNYQCQSCGYWYPLDNDYLTDTDKGLVCWECELKRRGEEHYV